MGNVFSNKRKGNLSTALHNTHGTNHLIENFWGDYVFLDKSKNFIKLFLGPCSHQMDCFFTVVDNTIIFSNKINYISSFSQKSQDFNHNFFVYFLKSYAYHLSYETPFNNIQRIQDGEEITFNTNQLLEKKNRWLDYLVKNNKKNPISFPDIIQHATETAIDDKIPIILQVSGGLDSTAVIYSLKSFLEKRKEIYAVNFFDSKNSIADERKYAKHIAKKNNINLTLINRDEILPFNTIANFTQNNNFPLVSTSKIESSVYISKNFGLTNCNYKIITGDGGDELFMCPPQYYTLLDLILKKKFKTYFKKYREINRFYALRKFQKMLILPYLMRNHLRKDWMKYTMSDIMGRTAPKIDWLNIDIKYNQFKNNCNNSIFINHPEYTIGKKIHFCFYQKALLLNKLHHPNIENFYSPLLLQHVIEKINHYPLEDFFQKNYDRYILRKSVYNITNDPLLWRRSKGNIQSIFHRGLIKNYLNVKDICFNGYFIKNNLINEKKLGNALDLAYKTGDAYTLRQIELLYLLEIFINSVQQEYH